jgi:ribose transport system substrate-binding protein
MVRHHQNGNSGSGRLQNDSGKARSFALVAVGASIACALAGCGSSSDTSAEQTSGSQTAASVPTTYNGPESSLAKSYPRPKATTNCTIGFLNLAEAVEGLASEQAGAESTAKALGCAFIGLDANSSAITQLNQFNQLLAQKVNAIIVYPVDEGALGPAVSKAKAAGIPVIADNTPADTTTPLPSGYTTDLLQGLDRDVFTRVQALAKKDPGGKFAILGTAIPSPAIEYYQAREEYWGERFGLQYLGTVSALSLSATDTSTAMTGLLGRYPTASAVMALNDDVAITASAVAARSGRKGILILGDNGYQEGVEAVESGQIFATYKLNTTAIGQQLAYAAVDSIENPGAVPKRVVAPLGTLITVPN